MPKYGIGESVRFKAPELLVSTGGYSFKIGTDGLVGRVTGSARTTDEETKYYVDVKLPRSLSASVSCILGISHSSDVTLKLSVLESKLQSEKEYSDLKFDKFINRVIPFPNPNRYFIDADFASFQPSKEALDSLREFARTGKVNRVTPAGGGAPAADGGDNKMPKSRCVKLLESYRAEREKVKKDRKFERCLRDSVVDEALERAIELLKGGAE